MNERHENWLIEHENRLKALEASALSDQIFEIKEAMGMMLKYTAELFVEINRLSNGRKTD